MSGGFAFDPFVLDPEERVLRRQGRTVALNARYLDALTLMVRNAGQLITKDRFHTEVWAGVPVTDDALTQCVRTLRRELGDVAASPRFIETVPKHGYRFIAPVERIGDPPPAAADRFLTLPRFVSVAAAGTVGGGFAGVVGGLVYGLAGAAHRGQPGIGALSTLVVLVILTVAVACAGAAAVSIGIAAAATLSRRISPWCIVGGAAGGLVIGGVAKSLGLDAFELLAGRSPGEITGAAEGLALGAAVGIGAWYAGRTQLASRGIFVASVSGGAAGLGIALLGGKLMSASLNQVATGVAGSRLSLDQIGTWFGESTFGPVAQAVSSTLEGALFAGSIIGSMMLARKRSDMID